MAWTMQVGWQAEGLVGMAGAAGGAGDWQVESDLDRFERFIESCGQQTGGRRGEVERRSWLPAGSRQR